MERNTVNNIAVAAMLAAGATGIGMLGVAVHNDHKEQVYNTACEGMDNLTKYDFTDKDLDIDKVIAELREEHPNGNYGKVTLESLAGREYQTYIGDREIRTCYEMGQKMNVVSDRPDRVSFRTNDGATIIVSPSPRASTVSPEQFKVGRVNNKSTSAERA